MRKRIRQSVKPKAVKTKRDRKLACLMSEEELRIVDRYLDKCRIANKSRWVREVVLAHVHKAMEDEYPTLFAEHEMRR